jgi:hypothetical protein
MRATIDLDIVGLGIVFYSPFAVAHIAAGRDYLESEFWEGPDVGRHVNACRISAFGTGSPGRYQLELYDGTFDKQAFDAATAGIELGIEVRDSTLCFRDLYDFIRWDPVCPAGQSVAMADGFYSIRVYTIRPTNADDVQTIWLHFEARPDKPVLTWNVVPDLSGVP